MSLNFPLDRSLLSPPGDTIRETIQALGMNQAELAARMGRPKEKINELIQGKAPLTMDTALMLERVLGVPVSFWIKRESTYRETLARIEEKETLESDLEWLEQFPLKAMHKLNILSSHKKGAEALKEVLRFFRFASPREWNNCYLNNHEEVAFRISLKNTPDPAAVAVWLRLGERALESASLPDYNEKKFKEALPRFRDIARRQHESFLREIKERAASCGVAVVFTPCLPKTKISGAARWVHHTPLIQLSDLYKTADQLWFTFFHEACHILKHGKKEVFLEQLKGYELNEAKEKEADEFAANQLIPRDKYDKWVRGRTFFDETLINIFAREIGIHPGIVAGRLQHDGLLNPAFQNQLKVPVQFE